MFTNKKVNYFHDKHFIDDINERNTILKISKHTVWKHPPFAAAAFIITAALFFLSIFNDFLEWDDLIYVVNNPYIHNADSFKFDEFLFTPLLGYPLPLQVLLYRTINAIFGLNPLVFHLLNVLLHSICAALVSILLNKFFDWKKALAGALLWALHPIVVEPVSWITGLKDVLVVFFSLISSIALINVFTCKKSKFAFFIFIISSILAILSKPSAISIIPMIVAMLYIYKNKNQGIMRLLITTIIILACLWGMLAYAGTHGIRGAQTIVIAPPPELYVANILSSVQIHLYHLFFPVDLLPKYLIKPQSLTPDHLIIIIIFGCLAGLAVFGFVKNKKSLSFFACWILFFYAPFSNIIPLVRYTCDSYFYAPLVGAAGLFCLAWHKVEKNWLNYRAKILLISIVGIIIVIFATITFNQQKIWKNSQTLWKPLLEKHPNNSLAAESYAFGLIHVGKEKEALKIYQLFEKKFIAEKWIPPHYPTVLAKYNNIKKAKKLFLWAFENSNYEIELLYRNFIMLLLNNNNLLDASTKIYAKKALPSFAAYFMPREFNPNRLAHVAKFAGDAGDFKTAEILAGKAFSLSGRSIHKKLGHTACIMQKKTSCDTVWLK